MASGSGCASPAETSSEIAVEVVSQVEKHLAKDAESWFPWCWRRSLVSVHVAHPPDRANGAAVIYCWVSGRLWASGPVAGRCCRSWRYHGATVRLEAPCKANRGRFFWLQWGSVLGYFCTGRTRSGGEKMLQGQWQRTVLSLTVSYRFGSFFLFFPITISSSAEACFSFSDCSQRCAAAATTPAALPSGYCFGLNGFVSTLLAWPAGLIEFLIMSVSAADTRVKITYSSKRDTVWEKLNAAATAWGSAMGKEEEAEDEDKSRSTQSLLVKRSWWHQFGGNESVEALGPEPVRTRFPAALALHLGWARPWFLSSFSNFGSSCVQEKHPKSAPSLPPPPSRWCLLLS